jgi:hypothetical protein
MEGIGMIELEAGDYHWVEAFFDHQKQHIPALSVLQGNYPGRVFADNVTVPTLAVVWATGRWMYAAGNADSESNALKLTGFLQNIVIPDCKQRSRKWFEIYTDDSEAWTALFMPGVGGLKVYRHMESVYEFNRDQFTRLQSSTDPLSDGVVVEYAEFPVLGGQDHELPEARRSCFERLTTTGAVVKAGDHVVSVCRNNGFTVNDRYFIDVDTYAEAERGKGYATYAALALIGCYLGQGQLPLWETAHDNTASHKLALKLGFHPVESYPVFAFVIE